MTSLRLRMIEDLQVRNLSTNTQTSYLDQVSRFARHFGKSPEDLGPEEIRSYQVYLTNEKKLAPGSILIAVCALSRSNWTSLLRQRVKPERRAGKKLNRPGRGMKPKSQPARIE